MSIQEDLKNEEETNVVPIRNTLRLISGGGITDDNWLSLLNPGTLFLSRPKGQPDRWFLDEWEMIWKSTDGFLARLELTSKQEPGTIESNIMVETEIFSREHICRGTFYAAVQNHSRHTELIELRQQEYDGGET